MERIRIELPDTFQFTTQIPVRITDLNYGGHVGNDTVLTIMHEARMQYLKHFGYTELDLGGTGIIMSDVAIRFRSELFYGDVVIASVTNGPAGRLGFDIYYRLQKMQDGKLLPVADAKTGMVCYDYDRKKTVAIPEAVKLKLQL